MNAPTRLHEAQILYQAAIALIALCRYAAAESVLRDVVQLYPSHTDAEVQLALVLSRLGRSLEAEHQLRKILQQHQDDPRAADLLGQVSRYLWHLSWHKEQPDKRQTIATNASELAISAVHCFVRAHRADPRAYFAGYNALMLAYILDKIGVEAVPKALPMDVDALKTVVRYVAENEKEKAIENGDYIQQFWCTTTLAGLRFMDGDEEGATRRIREACAIPQATSFQLQSFRERLELLHELGIRAEFVEKALGIVTEAMAKRNSQCTCERVFVWSEYFVETPDRPSAFRVQRAEIVTDKIKSALQNWRMRSTDLAICGATNETDIIFAETCLSLGARVRILMREPCGREANEPLWPFVSSEWQERFKQLRGNDQVEIWFENKQLGKPPHEPGGKDPASFARRRQQQWLINTARMEASPITKPDWSDQGQPIVPGSPRLIGLFLRDRCMAQDGDDSSFLVRAVNEFDEYRGEAMIISP